MGEVTVEPARIALYGFMVARDRPAKIAADYWALAPARSGARIELGFTERPDNIEAWLRETMELDADAPLLRFTDPATGRYSAALIEDGKLRFAFYASPDPVLVSRAWAADLLDAEIASAGRSAILAGRPSADMPDPGPTVCACFAVGRNTLEAAVRDGCHAVDAIGAKTRAGTNCGSCKIELAGIIARMVPAVAAE
jgi:assimilatory nitrate reductase catalytic subunit